jgi:hypothetical protein
VTSLVVSSADVEVPERQPDGRRWRRLLHPVTAICAVQAAISLSLVWSNTAFRDEADYLWLGRLELSHWFHGASWPSAYAANISGSRLIYPPIGAIADAVGGLAAARLLSLLFMVGATVLLYLTASKLVDRGAAIAATALWAFSWSTLRLAFATFDPMSVFLTALSAWLIVQAGYRRLRGEFVAAAVVTLALAVGTAYAGLAMVPVVIGFAFVVWLNSLGAQQAYFCTGWFVGGLGVFFGLFLIVGRSWSGVLNTVISRSSKDHQSLQLVVTDVWKYSAIILVLAVVGIVVAVRTETKQRAALLVWLGAAAFVVPLAQVYEQTGVALDKHIAYGIWFASIAGGYAVSRALTWRPGVSKQLAGACCALVLIYPVELAWQSAWETFHGWQNSTSFIAALRPVVARTTGAIAAGDAVHIGEYYTPQGRDWKRWPTLRLDPVGVPSTEWAAYYREALRVKDFTAVVLFYPTDISTARERLAAGDLGSFEQVDGEPGLAVLTHVLAADPAYLLVASGPYSSAHTPGSFFIWQRV